MEDLVGRADRWRAAAARGGWAAVDIHAMGGDLDRGDGACSDRDGALTTGDRETLEAFANDAGRARNAMRMAAGLVAGVEDLMRQRAEILGARHRRAHTSAPRSAGSSPTLSNHAHLDGWTERAGRALGVMETLQASERDRVGRRRHGIARRTGPAGGKMTTAGKPMRGTI